MQLVDYAFSINKIRWQIRIFSCSRHIPVPDLNLWAKALLPTHLQCAWVSQSCQPFAIPWTIAGLAPLSMELTTGMGSYSLLQGIFLTQGSNPDLLHCRQILYHLSHLRRLTSCSWMRFVSVSFCHSSNISFKQRLTLVTAMVFPVLMYGCESWTMKKAERRKVMLLNCGAGEDSWESPGLQGDPTSPSWRRSVLGVHWEDWCWSWNSNTLATSCEELTHWKGPWCWEGLGAGGEGDGRGWDGWLASQSQWTWVWVNSRSWWWTGRPGVLWFMGLQRVGHDWVTELNWTDSM